MGESPWSIGKMEGDFINNIICIYNFLANLSPDMANILLNYKIAWRIFYLIIESCKILVLPWVIINLELKNYY